MDFFKKIFTSSSASKQKTQNMIVIYLDAELKKSIEVPNQTVENYEQENQFESEQFLYIAVINRKTQEHLLKRKLNGYEKLLECTLIPYEQEEIKSFIIVGFGVERSTIPKIITSIPLTDNVKFIRSGMLHKYSDSKNSFEECQLKLHHDYLTFYKLKEKEKKVSFMPLQNASVEMISDKKNMFTVKDKFKNIIFKTTSKEDMFGWLVAITEAIKIRNSQIYMNQLEERLQKSLKEKLSSYMTKCSNLKDSSRMIPLDDIGRKALKNLLKKIKDPIDNKLVSIIQAYLHMCKCRREKGEVYSEDIIQQIKISIQEMQEELPKEITIRNLESRNQFVKTIEEMMKYLDLKYRKEIIEKKHLFKVFENYLIDQYREDQKMKLKPVNLGMRRKMEESEFKEMY